MDYDLTRLGSREFEHLCQALALRVLGPGVRVFGDGPDGGREAAFENVTHPDPGRGGRWDGKGVLQAKFRQRPEGTASDTEWFLRQIEAELKEWSDPESQRVKKKLVPEYLLFTTNVVLSPLAGRGGVDRVHELIKRYADKIGLQDWAVWHYDQLCRHLDTAADVRTAYAGFTTPGDVLAQLRNMVQGTAADLGDLLTAHAAKALLAEQWVRLGQAGEGENQRLALGRVGVDLPAVTGPDRRNVHVARYLIERGDAVLRPSRQRTGKTHVVVLGGPGQGKTTIGQLICQAYRLTLLAERPGYSLGEAHPVRDALLSDLQQIGLPIPAARRWPLRIALSEYGDAIAGGEELSLLQYIARQVSRRTPDRVTATQMRAWLKSWPWLLVLDGLDEVAARHVREDLVRRVSEFLIDAASADADLLLVATTRPQGYAEEFAPTHYDHVELQPLTVSEAVQYAGRLASVRHAADPDMEEQVVARVREAAEDDVTARLMRTPLQLTIMSLLLENRARVPQDRHGLFDAYYDTIYTREVAKPGTTARLLDAQRNNINALHDRVGLLLQVRAEKEGEAEALLPEEELLELAVARLRQEGHEDADAEKLGARIVEAATRRLVLLVPKTAGHIGFEVRSLQEFMAARALIAGTDDAIAERLRVLATSAHWRNTWLLAAGRAFATREHLRDRLITLLREVDTADLISMLVAPGAKLAVDLLDDDLAAGAPRFQRLLVQHALELLDHTPDRDVRRLAQVLFHIVSGDMQSRALANRAIDDAFARGGYRVAAAMRFLHTWSTETGPVATVARQRVNSERTRLGPDDAVVALPVIVVQSGLRGAPATASRGRSVADAIEPHVDAADLDPGDAKTLAAILAEFATMRVHQREDDIAEPTMLAERNPQADTSWLDDGLSRASVADALVTAIDAMSPQDWPIAAWLRQLFEAWLQRLPRGEDVLALTTTASS